MAEPEEMEVDLTLGDVTSMDITMLDETKLLASPSPGPEDKPGEELQNRKDLSNIKEESNLDSSDVFYDAEIIINTEDATKLLTESSPPVYDASSEPQLFSNSTIKNLVTVDLTDSSCKERTNNDLNSTIVVEEQDNELGQEPEQSALITELSRVSLSMDSSPSLDSSKTMSDEPSIINISSSDSNSADKFEFMSAASSSSLNSKSQGRSETPYYDLPHESNDELLSSENDTNQVHSDSLQVGSIGDEKLNISLPLDSEKENILNSSSNVSLDTRRDLLNCSALNSEILKPTLESCISQGRVLLPLQDNINSVEKEENKNEEIKTIPKSRVNRESLIFFDSPVSHQNLRKDKQETSKRAVEIDNSKPRSSILSQFDPYFDESRSEQLDNILNDLGNESLTEKSRTGGFDNIVNVSGNESHIEKSDNILNISGNMDGDSEEKMNLIQEINRLKLELNQSKQENTTLSLELQKKEEVYLNAKVEFQQKEAHLKQASLPPQNNNNNEELLEMKKASKQQEAEINKLGEKNAHYEQIINEYESTLSTRNCETEKLKQEHEIVKKHLAAIEAAFSDMISKYDRSKEIIAGYGRNENALKESLEKSNAIVIKYEERYETLKEHARGQLEKANKDVIALKEKHTADGNKWSANIKRLEIKNAALEHSLEQKVSECQALANLCEELTAGTNNV